MGIDKGKLSGMGRARLGRDRLGNSILYKKKPSTTAVGCMGIMYNFFALDPSSIHFILSLTLGQN